MTDWENGCKVRAPKNNVRRVKSRGNDNEDLKYGYEFLDWEIIRVTDGTDNDLFGGLYCTRGRGRKIITTTVMGE